MIRIGLTGSIGMGKSFVARIFSQLGVPVFDADACVHRLQAAGGAAVAPIEARFPGTTGPQGVNRKALGARVIGNPAEMAALEAIIHPLVGQERQRFLRRNRARPMVVLDIPLLFETQGDRKVDVVLVVSAPASVQRRRVMARPGMTQARFYAIRASQMPDREKRRRADVIIETARPKWATRAQVVRLVSCLGTRKCG
jgi:dephospho-CoA kinase